jgi:hypothetical protein
MASNTPKLGDLAHPSAIASPYRKIKTIAVIFRVCVTSNREVLLPGYG